MNKRYNLDTTVAFFVSIIIQTILATFSFSYYKQFVNMRKMPDVQSVKM